MRDYDSVGERGGTRTVRLPVLMSQERDYQEYLKTEVK